MALSADKIRVYGAVGDTKFNDLLVEDTAEIFKGSACSHNAGDVHALVATEPFVGFAEARVVGDGKLNVNLRSKGYVNAVIASITLANVGDPVSMSDDDTFTLTTTGNSSIGYVHALDPTVTDGVIIRFDADLPHSAA